MKTKFVGLAMPYCLIFWMVSSWFALVQGSFAAQPTTSLTRGPYIQMTTKNSTIIRWRTDEPAFSEVRFGSRPDHLDTEIADLDLRTEHRVQFGNLAPG